jgi:hypothetical protein
MQVLSHEICKSRTEVPKGDDAKPGAQRRRGYHGQQGDNDQILRLVMAVLGVPKKQRPTLKPQQQGSLYGTGFSPRSRASQSNACWQHQLEVPQILERMAGTGFEPATSRL